MEADKVDLEAQLRASLKGSREQGRFGTVTAAPEVTVARGTRGRRKASVARQKRSSTDRDPTGSVQSSSVQAPVATATSTMLELCSADQMTLHQKLGEVRKRIGYIQKRGYNERNNYTYVTAADIAGTVGDILAELGVVVIPSLESITYEQPLPGRPDSVRVARVIMAYAFTDVNNREEITVKVAGEGVDAGDKAPYKAMTGALKYALLQSFLLATGDDPEDERTAPVDYSGSRARSAEQPITSDELCELHQLIEDTNTELERVLAYYKLSSLKEMTAGTYRRAVELLKRKQAKLNGGESAHAQN